MTTSFLSHDTDAAGIGLEILLCFSFFKQAPSGACFPAMPLSASGQKKGSGCSQILSVYKSSAGFHLPQLTIEFFEDAFGTDFVQKFCDFEDLLV